MKNKLKGTGVALVTPFKKDMSIDFGSLDKLVKHVIAGGADYLVVQGTTGESATLNKNEKLAVLNCITDSAESKVPIVLGVGGNNTYDVVNTIKTTDFTGIDAILSVAPYYNKPTQSGIYKHYKEIVSASPVPVILYNVPGRTSVNISAETTLKLASDFSNIVAVKEASGNFSQIMNIIKNKPDSFLVISGDDAITMPLILSGAVGVISVSANAVPKQFSEMVNYALKGDAKNARKLHYKLLGFNESIFLEGNPGGIKAALKVLSITEEYVRLPLDMVSRKTAKIIADELTKVIS